MDGQAAPRIVGRIVALGATLAGTGVALGAFGTHALRARLSPADLAIFATGVQYQTLHGVAIVALAGALGARARLATTLMGAGAAVFGLSLYALALGGPRILGAVAPVGGLLLMAGWAAAVYEGVKASP